jgi:hypothetical protein
MKDYFSYTLKPSYNFIFGGLLLVLYEVSMLLLPQGAVPVRNAVDSLFDQILNLIPSGTLLVSSVLLLAGIAFLVGDLKKGVELKTSYFGLMGLESALWAALVFFNLGWLVSQLVPLNQLVAAQVVDTPRLSLTQELALSLGAGFYEEFFFRLILVYILLFASYLIGMNHKATSTRLLVLAVSAVLFSLAHFDFVVGSMGDAFAPYPFIFRTIFGLLMSFLLMYRGFAIAAWCHALYDVFVYLGRALVE